MHTIKPLDKELISECAEKYAKIFTIEEHNILGGLGSAVAEVLAEKGFKGTFRRIGIPDTYSSFVGSPEFLLDKFNLTPEKMSEFILKNI
jgi:transketolase